MGVKWALGPLNTFRRAKLLTIHSQQFYCKFMAASLLTTSSTLFPAQLVVALAEAIPAYKAETTKVKAAIASMLWNSRGTQREHTAYHGYFSFQYQEIEVLFDGKFEAINSRLQFVDVLGDWHFKNGSNEGYTKGYRPTLFYVQVLNRFLSQGSQGVYALLNAKGEAKKAVLPAIASWGINGVKLKRWRFANASKLLNRVPVNLPTMEALLLKTETLVSEWEHELHVTNDPELKDPSFLSLDSLQYQLRKFLRVANATTGGIGCVPHRYQESDSGRLYATGAVNLQNAPKVLRHAALAGFYDYDIANCHFSVLLQMAASAGIECPSIESYLEDKAVVRSQLAQDIGISIEDAKKTLLALMYGTQLTTYYKNAIPIQIGREKARDLYAHPLFSNIARELKLTNKGIHMPTNTQGSLINCFEKTVNPTDMKKNQQIAHLIQGVEAAALRTCLEMHLDSIVVLQHDGFTSMREIETKPMEDAIYAETGFKLTIEMKKVSPDFKAFAERCKPTNHSFWTRSLNNRSRW